MRSGRVQTSKKTGGSDEFQTPGKYLDLVRRVGPIGLDPCTTAKNPVGARRFFTEADNAFSQGDWLDYLEPGELAYSNPPYSQMISTKAEPGWANLIAYQAAHGAEMISLVGARTETGWFHALCWDSAAAVCFVRGRIRFIDSKTGKPAMAFSKKEGKWKPASAEFPSAFIYHGRRPWDFEAVFQEIGKVIRL